MTSSRSETVRPEPVEGQSTDTASEQVSYVVYMLRCVDGSYYTSHTDALESMVAAHHSGAVPGYTRIKRPVTLVYSESFSTRLEALGRERQIKGWNRTKKQALVRGDWELLRRLAKRNAPTGFPQPVVNPRDLF